MPVSDDELLDSFLSKPPPRPTPGVVFAQPQTAAGNVEQDDDALLNSFLAKPPSVPAPAGGPVEHDDDRLLNSFLSPSAAAQGAPAGGTPTSDPIAPLRKYLPSSAAATGASSEADFSDPYTRDPATWDDTEAAVQNVGKTVANLVTPAAQGITQGFAPRLGAFADSDPLGKFLGTAPANTPTYDQALKDRQNTLNQVQQAYPIGSKVAEGAGSVLGMAVPGGAAANAARELGFAGRAAAGAATGAAMGGVQGASESKDLGNLAETGKDAFFGAKVGAAFGAGLPIAGATFGKAYQVAAPFLSSAPAGLTRTGAGLLANAIGPNTVSRLDALGPQGMIADTSPSALGLTQGIASKGGPAADTVVNALENRAGGQSDRLLGSFDQNLGPAFSPREVQAMMEARQAATSPMYEDAIRNAPAVDISPVMQQLENARLYAKGTDAARLDRFGTLLQGPQRVNGIAQPEYDARALHRAKTEMDAQIEGVNNQTGSAAATATRDMVGVRAALNHALETQVPGYAEANLAYRTAARGGEAFDAGRQALKPGENVLWPQDLDHQFASLPLEQQALMRAGTRSDIEAGFGTNRNDLAAANKTLGAENDFNRPKMGTIFGPEQRDNVVRDVTNEQRFADTYSKVVQGSQSAQRLGNNAAIDAAVPQYVLPKSGTMTGLLSHGGEYLARKAFGAMAQASGDSTRQALARVLVSGGPPAQDNIQALSRALLGQGNVAQAINDALSHRAALAAALTGYREATR